MILFLIFIIIPLIELSVFSIVGSELGLTTTLLLCLVTALIGGYIVRKQGLNTLMKGQSAIHKGALPIEELFDGFCIVISGSMLFTPGFFTDALGFALLIPQIRNILRHELSKRMDIQTNNYKEPTNQSGHEDIIEGKFERVEPSQLKKNDNNP